MRRSQPLLVATLATLAIACADAPSGRGMPDRATFDAVVYPLLMRDCGFSTCHGAPGRFFHLYGPGRMRLDPTSEPFAPPTAQELELSFQRSIAMLDSQGRPEASLLLAKPLDPQAGGAGHQGVDHFGRDVYTSEQAPAYQQLLRWASTGTGVLR